MTQEFITIETMKTLRRGKQGMGTLSEDSAYIANGHYPLVDNMPVYDNATQTISSVDTVDEINKVVNRVYTVIDIPLEELIAKKIADGEAYITKAISDMVNTLNAKYGVNYKDIYAVGLYGNSPTYPLATQCKTVWDWNELIWATARTNQASVLAGTMTDAEFLDALPVAPVV